MKNSGFILVESSLFLRCADWHTIDILNGDCQTNTRSAEIETGERQAVRRTQFISPVQDGAEPLPPCEDNGRRKTPAVLNLREEQAGGGGQGQGDHRGYPHGPPVQEGGRRNCGFVPTSTT